MMLLKKYSYLLLAGMIATFSVACDDEDDTLKDTQKPTATLTSPTADELSAGFAQGSSFTVTGTVSDDRDLEQVTLKVTAPNGGASWFDKTWTEAQFTGNTLQLNETINVPADAAVGTHIMTLTAVDDGENVFTQSWNIEVMAAEMQPNVTFNLTVPTGTPENAEIYVIGDFLKPNGWESADEGDTYKLTRNEDGTYSGNFALPTDKESKFKFRIKSDDPNSPWKFEERTADCAQVPDRTATGTAEMQTMTITIENFQNITCTP